MNIEEIIKSQREFFNTNQTKTINFRLKNLKKIKKLLKDNEDLIYKAIYEDFRKSEFETYLSELSLVYHEINSLIKNIKKWSKPKRVYTGLTNFPAKSYIIPEPLGNTLVIGAWNYPYQLSLLPAITALAAGNTVIIKPSELPSNSSKVLAKIINENFDSNYFCVIEGSVKETTQLLENKFDKIFFTGSTNVGKIVYKAAAKHLTPVTLELGGKSPTFVLKGANLKMTAKRMVWAKFLNAGQTCIAPDYVLVEKSIEKEFLEVLKNEIEKQYSLENQDNYLQIINTKNFDRLDNLLEANKVFCGGNKNKKERYISPTILHNISFNDAIMKEEIFGPILPVIPFSDLDAVITKVKEKPKPLSLYIYAKNRSKIKKIVNEISFGGGAINDSVMHFTNSNLPFGGVGLSGMGNYHGKNGFKNFSHYKSILDKPFWLEFNLKYAPYSKLKMKIMSWLIE